MSTQSILVNRCSLTDVLGALLLVVPLSAQEFPAPQTTPKLYAKQRVIDGVPIQATHAVDDGYLEIASAIYAHMTSRTEPYDFRALHRESGFRILLITEEESFLDLPEYVGQGEELEEAGGLGGSIGEFHIAIRVGSPHALVHEMGHGIYHSAIQFEETGGARDEEAWYRDRVRAVHDLELEQATEQFGEAAIHEVLLASEGSFSTRLAHAWREAEAKGTWKGEYAGTEPNEYWAEGVALWFRAWSVQNEDSRRFLQERDPLLHALCASIFPDTNWTPFAAHAASAPNLHFDDDESEEVLSPELANFVDFLDRDGDDQIEAYEGAEALLFMTEHADEDGDGILQPLELSAFLYNREREREAESTEIVDEFDSDGDGRLIESDLPDQFRTLFPRIDKDHDAFVTSAELRVSDVFRDPSVMIELEFLDFFREMDQDGDDSLLLADFPPDRRAEFTNLDLDSDGQLSREEWLQLARDELRGAVFEAEGTTATMTGTIGPSTPGRVLELILENPRVTTIVMLEVPGSLDDESNLRAARLVRRAGLATHVPADGEVASGGTDFFLAGHTRSADVGARFGVHSWGGFGEEGAELPRSDPEHEKYLEFYREMNIPEDFYWFTLEAAPADDIHWMTPVELETYDMLTGGRESRAERPEESGQVRDEDEPDLIGGCVQRVPRADVPEDPWHVGEPTTRVIMAPLVKCLDACGVILAAEASVSDEFLMAVGKTVADIFRQADGIDREAQRQLLAHLYTYAALLPVPRTEASFEALLDSAPESFEALQSHYSICDIIMAEVPEGQVMEALEHILHTVSDVGLHYLYPEEWGLSRDSELWRAMQLAIALGHYDIRSYEDLNDAEPSIRDRVLMQEFAYWFLTTAWDLQRPYGPNEEEWTLRTPAELRAALPHFFAVHERTSNRVMRAPMSSTLAELGPKRADERR